MGAGTERGRSAGGIYGAEGKRALQRVADYDSLLFGAPLLVRNRPSAESGKRAGRRSRHPERIVLSDIIDRLQVTREQLIEIGILVGTDFNQGIGVSAERQR